MTDDVVIGGGLAGLAAAAYLARAGRRVRLLERGKELGGRARTSHPGGISLNLGPHALYRGGPAWSVLGELGVPIRGTTPPSSGVLVRGDRLHPLPTGPVSLLTSSALPFGTKLDGLSAFAALGRVDPATLQRASVGEWLEQVARTGPVRDLFRALITLSTYGCDPRQSAGAALAQLQLTVKHGVVYVDGGWEALVTSLRDVAAAAGVAIETGVAARELELDAAGSPTGVRLSDGRLLATQAVVIAASPAVARQLVPGSAGLARAAEIAVPAEVFCLDLALRTEPGVERPGFALTLDERHLYFSDHSRAARLGPDGVEVIHAAKYLAPGAHDDAKSAREVEALVDLLRPGWRDRVVERRALPRMVATHAVPLASTGGLPGRQPVQVAPGLVVAGDWVGDEGLLADAALGSARAAARALLAAPAPAATLAA